MTARRYAGRVALVTGAGRGLGRAIAVRLAEEGATVAALDLSAADAESCAAELRDRGAVAAALHSDVSLREHAHRAVSNCIDELGGLHVLVNNAGIGRVAPFLDVSDDDWRDILSVNLLGSFMMAQEAARHMVAAGRGTIVNIASICAHWANHDQVAYSASKAGVVALTRSVAVELGSHGVRCNALSPGPIQSELTDRMLSAEGRAERERRNPMKRFADVGEIAAAVAFLGSDDASFVNGAVLNIDGGLLIAGI
jgi:3-oxoacyl-[acyl-carrier protein] reductase